MQNYPTKIFFAVFMTVAAAISLYLLNGQIRALAHGSSAGQYYVPSLPDLFDRKLHVHVYTLPALKLVSEGTTDVSRKARLVLLPKGCLEANLNNQIAGFYQVDNNGRWRTIDARETIAKTGLSEGQLQTQIYEQTRTMPAGLHVRLNGFANQATIMKNDTVVSTFKYPGENAGVNQEKFFNKDASLCYKLGEKYYVIGDISKPQPRDLSDLTDGNGLIIDPAGSTIYGLKRDKTNHMWVNSLDLTTNIFQPELLDLGRVQPAASAVYGRTLFEADKKRAILLSSTNDPSLVVDLETKKINCRFFVSPNESKAKILLVGQKQGVDRALIGNKLVDLASGEVLERLLIDRQSFKPVLLQDGKTLVFALQKPEDGDHLNLVTYDLVARKMLNEARPNVEGLKMPPIQPDVNKTIIEEGEHRLILLTSTPTVDVQQYEYEHWPASDEP